MNQKLLVQAKRTWIQRLFGLKVGEIWWILLQLFLWLRKIIR